MGDATSTTLDLSDLTDVEPKQPLHSSGRISIQSRLFASGLPPICRHSDHEILADAALVRQGTESPAVGTSRTRAR